MSPIKIKISKNYIIIQQIKRKNRKIERKYVYISNKTVHIILFYLFSNTFNPS